MFVLLGEQLPDLVRAALQEPDVAMPRSLWWLAGHALLISLGLLLRWLWVYVSLRLTVLAARRQGRSVYRPNPRLALATSLAGVRGAITLAGILTLPLALPGRDLATFLASTVIVVSLVLASVGLPRVLRGLEVPAEEGEGAGEDRARLAAALAALAAFDRASQERPPEVEDADLHASAADHVRGVCRHRLAGSQPGDGQVGRIREAEQAERLYRLAALEAERGVLQRMARHGELSDETARKLVREIDLIEARYR